MTETKETTEKTKLSLSRPGKLELRKTVDAGQVRQSFSHGRSKAVAVEVRRKRTYTPGADGSMAEAKAAPEPAPQDEGGAAPRPRPPEPAAADTAEPERRPVVLRTLTESERAARARALKGARQAAAIAAEQAAEEAARRAEEAARQAEEAAQRAAEEAERRAEAGESPAETAEEQPPAPEAEAAPAEPEAAPPAAEAPAAPAEAEPEEGEDRGDRARKPGRPAPSRVVARRSEPRRRTGKLTIAQALDDEERIRSLASVRRARERERRLHRAAMESSRVVREVVVPETITVQELANRMAERGGDVVKALMRMGVMATITQSIDADTAEVVVNEFGHRIKRVSEADVEIGFISDEDPEAKLKPRPPVVTIMGHVDHGKTSLLDALRKTDVAAREAGGITQHIGAYQVALPTGQRITFIDTPGHEAFSAMRARGANVTDIVILVVAADDGVMPQTVEAIHHARAAGVPIIIAVNKIDKPDADPSRVRNELLQHEIVTEEVGGDVLSVEVSAVAGTNLDRLLEAIQLQAEILELKADPDRTAEGVVVEARLERGRGTVATLLVRRGTLRTGDIVVAGGEWGRVRAMFDYAGNKIEAAGPAEPVEVLGLNGAPAAGDVFAVVENESRAREITDYRQRREREARASAAQRGTLEEMFAQIESGRRGELGIIVKADVQGSAEAIVASADKLATDEVAVRVLHTGVGGINESDVTLAKASNALIVGFNVRANAQARLLAEQDKVDIRYYSIIYNLVDDLKQMLSGMLAPAQREKFLGNAQILEVFSVTKAGKVAGCRITDGIVKRGAKVRLLRDDVVVHEGTLSTLRRFKDEVREVREGFECGMSFENYQDIRVGDVIECFEIEEVARTL